MTFTDLNFNETFTAEPGDYLFILLQRGRMYNQKIFTYKNASFIVTGDDPSKIEITGNGFDQHKLLKRPDKIAANKFITNAPKTHKRLATRGTVKLRKFKF